MSIDQSVSGNTPSSTTYPKSDVSDIVVENHSTGEIVLELKTVSGTWVEVSRQSGAYSISTPDNSIQYRFRPINVETVSRVYMGP